jgi:hypothetical protein
VERSLWKQKHKIRQALVLTNAMKKAVNAIRRLASERFNMTVAPMIFPRGQLTHVLVNTGYRSVVLGLVLERVCSIDMMLAWKVDIRDIVSQSGTIMKSHHAM